ncbi:hypothetical protein LYSHEL_21810 [Lysobacter helvus]|uniref:Uncharacterized protein n=3 Tax=Lysobacterales TaxID=135614 RepID=A0ABN6FU17_9GAMM|nr:hypothetical protein LYSCAS_21820 [Lysobacter caseinilyticus]BCT96310.1 hypothetical protein LYSHEL_21810 [Lysobacter helvus]
MESNGRLQHMLIGLRMSVLAIHACGIVIGQDPHMQFAALTFRVAIFIIVCAAVASPALAATSEASARRVFDEANAICMRDAGALWGHSLCGPILVVDPDDRSVVASELDIDHVLKPAGRQFVGVLPASVIIANTPTEWSGTRWTQLIGPLLPEDDATLKVLVAHELFHRVQPDLGLARPEMPNQHLDALEGRYLLQLEWRALAGALKARTSEERLATVADAVAFRAERYRIYPEARVEEAALEINEGIPEYTGVMVGLEAPEERVAYALRDLSKFVDAASFVRSFAYATGPAYGLLLDGAQPGWRGQLGSGQSLDQILSTALKLKSLERRTIAARTAQYDDGSLRATEETREQGRLAEIKTLEDRLVDGPVLKLPLARTKYQFNPQTLKPLGVHGTVYPTMRLTDAWGSLEVEDGGALVNGDTKVAFVSAAGIDAVALRGNGWKLVLNPGWKVASGPREGDYQVSPVAEAP